MNQYTQAVDLIEQYLEATNAVFEEGNLPNIESKLQFALKILKGQIAYDAGTITTQ